MGRDRIKNTALDLDYAAGIRKLCDGNLRSFYEQYLHGEIPTSEFYVAMKPLEPITARTEQAIDEAYFEALRDVGLTHDALVEIPPFIRLLDQLIEKLGYVESGFSSLSVEEATQLKTGVKFYAFLLNKGLIRFVEKKKSKAIS